MPQVQEIKDAWRERARTLRTVFWAGFLVRVLYMTLAHTYKFRTLGDHFQFGWEAARIARALVTGYGYSDPFSNFFRPHTGPTAWLPPIYPLLIAAVFKAFGVFTLKSAWVILTINCALSAWTSVAIWEIGIRCFDAKVARWSAWIWALYPAAMQYAVRWVWEMTLTTALFAWLWVLMLRMREVGSERFGVVEKGDTVGRWGMFGLIWAAIALSNPTLVVFLPVAGIWILMGARGNELRRSMGGAVLAGVVFVACIAPWTWRNWVVFHAFIPLRGNFGAELYMGNGPGAQGFLMENFHPFQDLNQLQLYADMGEVKYVAMRGAAAKAVIAADPGHFVADCLKRVDFFWISVPHPADDAWYVEVGRVFNFAVVSLSGLMGLGLALWRRVPAAGLMAWAFLLLPVPYYLVTVHARFRHPLEPLICILGVYLFQSAEWRKGKISAISVDPEAGTR
jgi:4-amino-4-deoxy-L-arabinose transferase-like glycosyltransferase